MKNDLLEKDRLISDLDLQLNAQKVGLQDVPCIISPC